MIGTVKVFAEHLFYRITMCMYSLFSLNKGCSVLWFLCYFVIYTYRRGGDGEGRAFCFYSVKPDTEGNID